MITVPNFFRLLAQHATTGRLYYLLLISISISVWDFPVFASALNTSAASAGTDPTEEYVYVRYAIGKAKPIAGLTWDWPAKGANIRIQKLNGRKDDPDASFITVKGKFVRKNWNLLVQNTTVTLDANGRFEARVKPRPGESVIRLNGVGPMGNVERSLIYVTYIPARLKTSVKAKKFSWLAGVSGTHLIYRETGIASFTQQALTGKLGATYAPGPRRWELGISAFGTLLPVHRSRAVSVQYLGLNLRGGWVLSSVLREPWELKLLGGFYYTRMSVTGNQFGYDQVAGPQLYPSLKRRLPRGRYASGYLKFSPVSQKLAVPSFNNREIALGLTYAFKVGKAQGLAIQLDLANIQITNPLNASVQSQASTVSLGTSYLF